MNPNWRKYGNENFRNSNRHGSKLHQHNTEMEGRVSDIEDMIKEMNASVKEIDNSKNLVAENIQKIWGGMRTTILRKIELEEEEIQVNGKENILNKITEEIFFSPEKEYAY